MLTNIDLVFDSLLREADPPFVAPAPGEPLRVARYPLALILEKEMRRRARFLDSGLPGPMERWPLATPEHLVNEFGEIADRLKALAGMRHTAALERVARCAGYRNWQHVQDEKRAFEASTGAAFRNGLVIATVGSVSDASAFIADQGLLFLAASDLVREYGATDCEGGWYQLTCPSTIGGGRIEDTRFHAGRQLFLREVRASYWAPNRHVAQFYRWDGPAPESLEAAVALAKAAVTTGDLHYVWLAGTMETVTPMED